mgnify:FL=1
MLWRYPIKQQWFCNVNCDPGFWDTAFDTIKRKVTEAPENGREVICSLMLDEMAVRKQLDFDGEKTWGYIDYGIAFDSDSLELVTEARFHGGITKCRLENSSCIFLN